MSKNIFSVPLNVLKALKNFAIDRQKDIENKLKNLDREDPFKDPDRLNDNTDDEDAKEQVDHERVAALKEELLKKLEEIKIALNKIDHGKYGFCEKCHKLIDTARLSVNPFARFCLNCEKKKGK